MAYWIFQGNPKNYDLDSALNSLSEISWRVPQYTSEIAVGDRVVLWRSGKESGIVGIGVVTTPPALRDTPAVELRFVVDSETEGGAETRVVVSSKPVPLVPKQRFVDDPDLADHQIVRAPMGTVFRVSTTEESAIDRLVDDTWPEFDAPAGGHGGLPEAFGWKDRSKDVYPLPGGYDSYLVTFEKILSHVDTHRPVSAELIAEIQSTFGSSQTSSRMMTSFLKRVGFLNETAGQLGLSESSRRYLADQDPAIIVAQVHSRVRFFGEMLGLLTTPRTTGELLEVANASYGMNWNTNAQIQRRRGWLQSAGALTVDGDGHLSITAAGTEMLGMLQLHEPIGIEPSEESSASEPPVEPEAAQVKDSVEVADLCERILSTSRLSESPDDFEYAIADAMSFLGFKAEKLGGAGKTDVTADAYLGRDDSYRIIIDGKTTRSGPVGDGQIDWDTIDDHRAKHDADYVAVIGPEFSGNRIFDRATRHSVLLMTAAELVSLLRLHADSPIGLDEFRPLFETGTSEVDLDAMADSVEARSRLIEVSLAALNAIEENVSEVGTLSSRDLFLLLRNSDGLDAQEDEIQATLEALSSPLIGALVVVDDRYRPGGPRETTVRRIELLAKHLS